MSTCSRGHERNAQNTFRDSSNRRRCRLCDTERHREHKQRERANLARRVQEPGLSLFSRLPVLS